MKGREDGFFFVARVSVAVISPRRPPMKTEQEKERERKKRETNETPLFNEKRKNVPIFEEGSLVRVSLKGRSWFVGLLV